jgi:hypothetical protein
MRPRRCVGVKRCVLLALAGVLISSSASASVITVFSGQDNGAPVGGPFPSSAAAQTAFLAAAGATSLIDFENLATGFYSPVSAAPDVSIALNAVNYGAGISGISGTTFGNLYGFNTTPGGSRWLGFPTGSATFNFTNQVNAFGFWITGIQTAFTSVFTVTFNDGSPQTLNIPINVNGGAQYFGFTIAGGNLTSLTITNASGDYWGIDDVRYSSAVPEPATLLLLGSGIALMGISRRRRTS